MAQVTKKPTSSMSTPDSSGKGFMIAVAVIVVLGLAAVAFFVTNRGESASIADAGEQTADITIDGAPLAPMPPDVQISDASDSAIGTVAPTLTGTNFDDEEITIGPDGRPKAIYFLAHWCPHCQAEVPVVQGLIDAGRVPEGMDIYAVSTSVDRGQGNYPASTWLDEEGFTPTVIRDDEASSALQAFGGSSFPYVVYLDGENRVVTRSSGSLGGDAIGQLWQLAASG
jgi:thiol-disulfide isomerase/thioredoxin